MPEKIHEVIETENGYITFKEKPSEKELAEYYKNKYFQEEHGNYKVKYDAKELKHKKFICNLIAEKAMQLFPQAKTVYDIACGEGFLSYIQMRLIISSRNYQEHIFRAIYSKYQKKNFPLKNLIY